jgi:hypothetical protein
MRGLWKLLCFNYRSRGVEDSYIVCVIVWIQYYDPRLRLRGSSPVSRGGGV